MQLIILLIYYVGKHCQSYGWKQIAEKARLIPTAIFLLDRNQNIHFDLQREVADPVGWFRLVSDLSLSEHKV